ncbi:thioesterase family protein [Amycolatopsis jejuensis]|uniref:thioesterase family protein n=1 Tax=Amycolatopsis jejuensis TaxID=330084 RepID=UPI0007C4B37A|nr:thioesterase family protein [Amycolatopsis jejuensis]
MLPSYEQVLELPALREGGVTPDLIDVNGHVNIRHYFEYGASSADVLIRRVGIDDSYRARRHMGVFAAEHHIRYFTEMLEGDPFSVHTVFLERSGKAGHLMAFVVDHAVKAVSCTVEILLVHVDMNTRRAVDFPDDIAAGLDEWIREAGRLTWPIPLSGAMGIRSER